ncbi:MAG: insulinase family protein [Armatimonadetes bacterium]|nr:insulinase family protein [Armatimonadota bacterium]
MRKHFAALATFVALCAVSPAFAAPPVGDAASPLPPLAFTDRTLPNGLRVLASENHQTPTVAIYVFYKVGSKDDPPGRSGFAHLFEHLMFKSTKNMASEQLDRLTEDVGGANNAYTADDVTVYHETVPSNHLERLLWAEAERMSNLTVDEKNFKSERAVVQEEFRQSYAANPYGDLYLQTTIQGFTKHPYKRPGIGNLAELQAATVTDVKAFHKTYYRPDNAVLVVVGDFDPAQLKMWADRYFGAVAKPRGAIPRVTAVEPPRTAQRHVAVTAPDVPLPAFSATYLTPGVADADTPALDVLASVLGEGESSRLYRALVYDKQIASEVSVESNGNTEAGLFTVLVTAASGEKLPDLETAAFAEMDKLREEEITAKELEKAKVSLVGGIVRARETVDGTANFLGVAAVLLGDPSRINTELARVNAVTAADVLRVAKKYLSPMNRVIVSYTAKTATVPVAKPDVKKVKP